MASTPSKCAGACTDLPAVPGRLQASSSQHFLLTGLGLPDQARRLSADIGKAGSPLPGCAETPEALPRRKQARADPGAGQWEPNGKLPVTTFPSAVRQLWLFCPVALSPCPPSPACPTPSPSPSHPHPTVHSIL